MWRLIFFVRDIAYTAVTTTGFLELDPMEKKYRLLMVEDSQTLAAIYASYLSEGDFELCIADSLATARDEWTRFNPDIVLLDVELPDGQGLDLLKNPPDSEGVPEVLVMTAFGSSEMAVEAIRIGAFDYLSKPFNADRLHVTLNNALDQRRLKSQVNQLAELRREKYCDFIGGSQPMQAVYRIIDALAASDATAFVCGESGTGKELAATGIHQKSKRKDRPFVALNCGAIPRELMESELFGHVKGAFTGATSTRQGMAAAADGGTLFLDEVCEMDLDLQKKMLRFVQNGEFQKVGSSVVERVDVRYVCATNRVPFDEVKAGRFREDLYYRLYVVPINMPPLRDRGTDILAIAEHLLKSFALKEGKHFEEFSTNAKAQILNYAWPGNVRELQNVIQQAVVLNQGAVLRSAMLSFPNLVANPSTVALTTHVEPAASANALTWREQSEQSQQSQQSEQIQWTNEIEPLWVVEKRTIEKAIKECEGNVNKAAGLLEVAPSTIYRKRQSWENKNLSTEET